MENFTIGVILVGVVLTAFLLWKSKKTKPTDPNFTDPGPVEDVLDTKDKR